MPQAREPDFEQIVREHETFVWRTLARHGVPARQLEDLSQDVFLTLHRSLSRFEARSSLRKFIYGICRRIASNYRQLAMHRRELITDELPEPANDTTDAFEALAGKEQFAVAQALVLRLPAEQREVLMLYDVAELTMREVAVALGCSQNTLFSRLYAARKTLAADFVASLRQRTEGTPRRRTRAC